MDQDDINIDEQELDAESYTIPWCVSVPKDPDEETVEQGSAMQEKFLKLPEAVKDKLVSHKTGEKIQKIGRNFGFNLFQMSDIARAVRSYYFGELKLEDFSDLFSTELEIDLGKAQEITRMVGEQIINDKSFETAYQVKVKEIPIATALKQYSKLGEQLITTNRIKIRVFPEPVRPSIKNWIDDYYENIGAGEHGSIERGNFLFHGENTKVLSFEDRQKLGMVLKSLDENSPLKINTESEEIIFDKPEGSVETKQFEDSVEYFGNNSNNLEKSRADLQQKNSEFKIQKSEENNESQKTALNFGNMKFSSPQKMTSEKPKNPRFITPIGMSNVRQERNANPSQPPSQTNPKVQGNVVDLRNS
jgi:hypothetical protein